MVRSIHVFLGCDLELLFDPVGDLENFDIRSLTLEDPGK
jgi:hypothetical protein